MVDPAAMHIVLSNAAMQLNNIRGLQYEDKSALAHHVAAMQSVNRRIADSPHNVTDEMLGAVLGVCESRHLPLKCCSNL
jgi:hypothetical protein